MITRRSLLALAGGAVWGQTARPVRIGMVGVGSRGTSLLRNLLDLPSVEIPAVCDINEANLQRAQGILEKAGRPRPEGYASGVEDFRRMAARDDLDAVLTATPWEWHAKVCVAAMKAGKYAATEVPAAITIEECWELVDTSEKTGMPCMMLENVNYYRNVLMILNMIRQGVFGDIVHCEGGYQHRIRKVRPDGELTWRGMHSVKRDANLYPTHPLGPIAWWTNINRGDRFTHLTSMSSRSLGINRQAARRAGPDHPNAKRRYALGDVNTTMIRTENGVTVTLIHDTQSPRPYDLAFKLQGTNGIYSGTLEKIFIEDEASPRENWQEMAPFYEKYEHPVWRKYGKVATKYGHFGGDYLELLHFVAAVRNRTQTPIDVYDSATWSAVTPLTEASVRARSAPVDFPDFTRGKWKTAKPVEVDL
jgi:predicted dehydrogenase